jgi:hypothetical protein
LLNYNGTLADQADDVWQHFTTADGLGGNFMVADVTIGPGGYKYFGFNGGLSRLMDNYTPFNNVDDHWTTYPGGVGGLFDGTVFAILFDQQNCLWAGGDNGLARKCGDVWTAYD